MVLVVVSEALEMLPGFWKREAPFLVGASESGAESLEEAMVVVVVLSEELDVLPTFWKREGRVVILRDVDDACGGMRV